MQDRARPKRDATRQGKADQGTSRYRRPGAEQAIAEAALLCRQGCRGQGTILLEETGQSRAGQGCPQNRKRLWHKNNNSSKTYHACLVQSPTQQAKISAVAEADAASEQIPVFGNNRC